jgi:hypothetical protein
MTVLFKGAPSPPAADITVFGPTDIETGGVNPPDSPAPL